MIKTEKLLALGMTAMALTALSMVVGVGEVGAQTELLTNSGFETNTGSGGSADSWTGWGNPGTEEWAAHSGSWGMALRAWISDSGGAYQDVSAVTAGERYIYKIWAIVDASYSGTFKMKLEWYDSGDSLIGTDFQELSLTTSWAQYTLTAQAPSNTYYGRVVFEGFTVNQTAKFDDASLELQAASPPTASFTYSPSSPTTADTIQFTDTSTDPDGTIVSWSWNFGDGGTSTAQNPTHQYSSANTYTVTLTVTDDGGLTDTKTVNITVTSVSQPPVAVIATTPSPASGPAPLIVNFDASGSYDSNGTIVSYSWDFGDGDTGAGITTSHTYGTGSYTATLTVTDDGGLTDTKTVNITVAVTQAGLLTNSGFETNTGAEGSAENWTGWGNPGTEEWAAHSGSWGMALRVWIDNSGGAYQDVSAVTAGERYIYKIWAIVDDASYSGTFNMKLEWYDSSDSLIGTDSQELSLTTSWAQYTLTAQAPSNTYYGRVVFEGVTVNQTAKFDDASLELRAASPPTASFTYSPSPPTTADTIQFTDTSTDPDGTIVSWSWNFGDGGTSTAQNPTRQYSAAGTYTVTLTVTDDDGLTDTESVQITVTAVTPFPVTVIATILSPASGTAPLTVNFDASGSYDRDGTIVSYSWDFGDGNTGAGITTSHIYSAGSYTATLTVTDDDGLTDTESVLITAVGEEGGISTSLGIILIIVGVVIVIVVLMKRYGSTF